MKAILLFHLLISLFLVKGNSQTAPKEILINLKKGHYVLQTGNNNANIGIFNGKFRLILIDNPPSVFIPRLKQQLKKITPRKISVVINTHFHHEHTNGNIIVGNESTSIVAHENARLKMQKDRTLYPPEKEIQKAYPVKGWPTITFVERMQLYDDQETIELTHVKNAHTDGDVLIQFKQANVFYTGDVFVTNGLPYIDEINGGDIYGMIIAMNYLINVANEESKIIPGHGKIAGMKEARDYRDMITAIRNKTIQLAREKKSEEEILRFMNNFIKEGYNLESDKDFLLHVLKMVQKHERL